MLRVSSRNTKVYKILQLCLAIFSAFYKISQPNLAVLLNLVCSSKITFLSPKSVKTLGTRLNQWVESVGLLCKCPLTGFYGNAVMLWACLLLAIKHGIRWIISLMFSLISNIEVSTINFTVITLVKDGEQVINRSSCHTFCTRSSASACVYSVNIHDYIFVKPLITSCTYSAQQPDQFLAV